MNMLKNQKRNYNIKFRVFKQTKCRKNQAESSNFSLVSHGLDTSNSAFFPWHMNCLLLIIAALDLYEIMNSKNQIFLHEILKKIIKILEVLNN